VAVIGASAQVSKILLMNELNNKTWLHAPSVHAGVALFCKMQICMALPVFFWFSAILFCIYFTYYKFCRRMVGPNTEYRRSFKEANFRCSSRTYETNLDYRHDRRLLEHHHNIDAYTWEDEESWDSGSSSGSCSSGDRPPSSLPAHKIKHQKLVDMYFKRLSKTQDIQVQVPDQKTPDNESLRLNLKNSTPTPDGKAQKSSKGQQTNG
jgi:hypothetical protein